ncbi:MAG TPA: hypothetical protein GXX37_00850 [Clostridiaceae bacterium]|nr:hypothetical protein [Clostridiaceae bacterium]
MERRKNKINVNNNGEWREYTGFSMVIGFGFLHVLVIYYCEIPWSS